MGLAQWLNRLILSYKCQHPTRVLVHVPAAPLVISAYGLERQWKTSLVFGILHPEGELLVPGLKLDQLQSWWTVSE